MKWLRSLWVLACAALIGCAVSDGGPVGTGISSVSASISGNVIDVQTASTGSAAADIATAPAVTVSIDGTAAQTSTDADGNFELSGNFSGLLSLRFTVPEFQVVQLLDVPAGSAIVLQDVELRPDGVQAQAARQLDFNGRVKLVDCTDGTLLVDDNRHNDRQFMVQLVVSTSIVRQSGEAASCGDIAEGRDVEVDGYIQLQPDTTGATNRVITALTVTLAPPPPPQRPQPVQNVRFAGDIAAINCEEGFIVIDDSMHRSRLRLSQRTVIGGTDQERLSCVDLDLGDHIEGQGQINLVKPGTIDTSSIRVNTAPPAETLRVFGFVAAIDCSSGLLLLNDPTSSMPVRLLPGTILVRDHNTPVQCSDIRLGDRVSGTGQINPNTPGAIDARMLMVTRRGPGRDLQ